MNTIILGESTLQVVFEIRENRLRMAQINRKGMLPLIQQAGTYSNHDEWGNPLTVSICKGTYAGLYAINTFTVLEHKYSDSELTVKLAQETIPLVIMMNVVVEGNVITWRGQASWRGDEAIDIDIYLPLLTKLSFGEKDSRAIMPHVSGLVIEPLEQNSYLGRYLGSLASPSFITEGDNRGIAWLDNNRADYAADPGAAVLRTYVVGHDFKVFANRSARPNKMVEGDNKSNSILAGISHTRILHPVSRFELKNEKEINSEESIITYSNHGERVEYFDIGPVQTYVYSGDWKQGAAWVRDQRQHLSFHQSPAKWYQQTTFLAEDMGDTMVRNKEGFYQFPRVIERKEAIGANLFQIPGFHDSEMLGTSHNWLNRGDYYFAAQNMGGFEAAKRGIGAIHRRGGRVLYYVEGLIMWKQSRIGLSKGKEWALMEEDGSYTEHYSDFWHMNPAHEGYQDWLAQTCADIVKTLGVDGFFIDSSCATHNHRNFNPDHPYGVDAWNWGMRGLLSKVRKAINEVNPETVLIVEGCGDLAREFVDGFLCHSHEWTNFNFDIPYMRFLHPELKVFESWSNRGRSPEPIEKLHLFNAVHGCHIYSHHPDNQYMQALSYRTRQYYDLYPEIWEHHITTHTVKTNHCIAELFEGLPRVITVGNTTDEEVEASVVLPYEAGVLFDRFDNKRVQVENKKATFTLAPWEFRAFELRA
jgi:hypothetical protein